MYRVFLYEGANGICEKLALLAAKSNGLEIPTPLSMLKTVAEADKFMYPTISEGVAIEVIGETILHIDKKIGDAYKTVLSIEQVEVLELPKVEDDENVVLQRHELIN